MTVFDLYRQAWCMGFKPEPLQTVTEWADRKRILSSKSAAEPGLWRTSRTPYLKEIMDCLSPSSPVERVVFMKGAQIGATEAGNNWIGYIIDQAPGPLLSVMPTVEMAKRNSKQRIAPLIEETPALSERVKDPRRRDSGNTVLSKEFPGGILIMTGANSAVGLRSMPVRYLFLDEIDGYPPDADGEGDPIELAEQRTVTFARRKIFMPSTPTVAGISRIEAAYEESDQRRYFVPCPDCGHPQTLKWSNVKWPEHEPEKAAYCCEDCGSLIEHRHKASMLAWGEWQATAEGDGSTAGFHLSALYSPWFTWAQAAKEFIESKPYPERLKTWVNTTLGEVWKGEGEAPAWKAIMDRAEDYEPRTIPEGGVYLTAGADVQRDRIEAEVVAWGPNGESWSVDFRALPGDPYQPEVWRDLSDMLDETFEHEAGGLLKIGRLAIDSGYATGEVYKWVRLHPANRVMAIKGRAGSAAILGSPTPVTVTAGGKKIPRGAKVWPLGVDALKAQLYGRLKAGMEDEETPARCHFPRRYPEEFFKQLTAEKLVSRKNRKGFVVHEWAKSRDRNEALDCRIYASAAALAAGCDRWSPAKWGQMAAALGVQPARESTKPPPAPVMQRQPRRSSSFERRGL
ncbi:MAG: phage terminase large subunit family protein [Methyloceanibacter sp.]|nr:phage terminase large subunit family protein [Methyloceanibacter sp.]